MKKKIVVALLLVALAAIVLTHFYYADRGRFTTEPEFTNLLRSASANRLVSPRDPDATLVFDAAFEHLGGQKFVLYGVADTEQHFFVETAPDNTLKSLYWLQFEAYLPGKDYHYDYSDSPGRLQIDGYEFYLDTEAVHFDREKKRRRGTDGALARAFLASKGYVFPQEFFYARLVHLTDASAQKELMIIYIEDLAPLGLTAAQLNEGGSEAARWSEVKHLHLEKIRNTLSIEPPNRNAQ